MNISNQNIEQVSSTNFLGLNIELPKRKLKCSVQQKYTDSTLSGTYIKCNTLAA